MRVSTFPTLFGEKAVVRLFAAPGLFLRIDELGLPAVLHERAPHLNRHATAIVRQALDDHRRAAWAIAFVTHRLPTRKVGGAHVARPPACLLLHDNIQWRKIERKLFLPNSATIRASEQSTTKARASF